MPNLKLPFVAGFYGKARTGKSTFAKAVQAQIRLRGLSVVLAPIADEVRRSLQQHIEAGDSIALQLIADCGLAGEKVNLFDGPKGPQERRLLQLWGKRMRNFVRRDYWVMLWFWSVLLLDPQPQIVLVPDVRLDVEIDLLRRLFAAKIYRITNEPFTGAEVPPDETEEVPPVEGTEPLYIPNRTTNPDRFAKRVSEVASDIIHRWRIA
jgi:hypothetical protein